MNPVDTVREYYDRIDGNDLDWVIALFREDAVYVRADATFAGLPEIRRFFRVERGIRGKHRIDTIVGDDDQRVVFVAGRFDGVGRALDPRAVDYADRWTFDAAGLVAHRQTYLGIGGDYVRQ